MYQYHVLVVDSGCLRDLAPVYLRVLRCRKTILINSLGACYSISLTATTNFSLDQIALLHQRYAMFVQGQIV